jgi:hypothetical protein
MLASGFALQATTGQDAPTSRQKLQKHCIFYPLRPLRALRLNQSFFLFTAEIAESAEKSKYLSCWLRQKLQKHCIFYPLRSLRALRLIFIVVNDSFYPFCKHANIEIDQEPQLKVCYFQIIQ